VKSDGDQLKQQILRIRAGPKYRPLDKVELGKSSDAKAASGWT